MPTRSEYALEQALIEQLQDMEYSLIRIDNDADMRANFKQQLEIHNQGVTLTPAEFERVLNHLNTGTVFEWTKILRDKFALKRDNNEIVYLSFLNCDDWCMNEFQVTHRVEMQGKRKNRYDVTLLINGLPLVQIELKKHGAELKVAFYQINRYQRDSYNAGAGLFRYVQLFIISNGVNTKYFANNAISNPRYFEKVEHLQDRKFVFIFDECHRSQFGDIHKAIKKFFTQAQLFGFTGTPIFADNAKGTEGNQQTNLCLASVCINKLLSMRSAMTTYYVFLWNMSGDMPKKTVPMK